MIYITLPPGTEGEISAWELASGGTGIYRSAIVIVYVLIAIFTALFIDLKALLHAYKRGKNCQNLFGKEFSEELLSMTVKELRDKIGLKKA